MRINYSAISHIGLVRENNEDNLFVNGIYRSDINQPTIGIKESVKNSGTFAVFDGMGGENFGEVASLKAAETLSKYDCKQLMKHPRRYIETANNNICNEIEKNEGRQIGTTVALLVIDKKHATIVNVGDSRIYRLKSGVLEQMSVDHTRAQQMIDAGIMTREEARVHQLKHMLTQHLGVAPDDYILEPNIIREFDISKGETFLLCSDGLADMLNDTEIKSVLLQDKTVDVIAETLIERALDAGGKDNVTVIVVKIQ